MQILMQTYRVDFTRHKVAMYRKLRADIQSKHQSNLQHMRTPEQSAQRDKQAECV